MSTIQIVLVVILIVSTIIGYLLINKVPSLLHTPLMSGMNALSGITLLGALIATSIAIEKGQVVTIILGGIAIIVATINVVSGFFVTHRMLKMFRGGNRE